MQLVAAGYLIFQLTGSAVQVGILAAVAKGPSLVVAPLGGWLADRVERRRLALILSGIQVVPAALLAILSFDGEIAEFEIYLLMFCDAVPAGLKRPVLAELAIDLVPERLSKQAMADSSIVFNLSRLCGPAIGGLLVATMGVAAAFGVTALSFAGVFVALLAIPSASLQIRECIEHCGLTTGAVIMWRALLLRTILETTLTFFVFVGPLEQIMPVVAADHGDGAQYIGLLLAAIAVGGLIASPIVRRLERQEVSELTLLAGGLIAAGVFMIVLGVSHSLALDIVTIILIGATWEVVWVVESTGVHFRSPAGISGQAMGMLYMIASVSAATGSVLLGWASDLIGLDWSLAIAGAGLILIGPCPVLWARSHLTEAERRSGQRQADRHGGAASEGAVDVDLATVSADRGVGDRHAEAAAAAIPGAGGISAVEALGDPGGDLRRHALPAVGDGDAGRPVGGFHT